jgi:hypothetical protein
MGLRDPTEREIAMNATIRDRRLWLLAFLFMPAIGRAADAASDPLPRARVAELRRVFHNGDHF